MGIIFYDPPRDIYERDELEEEKDVDEYKRIASILDGIMADEADGILIEPLRELPKDADPADPEQENRETEDKFS